MLCPYLVYEPHENNFSMLPTTIQCIRTTDLKNGLSADEKWFMDGLT